MEGDVFDINRRVTLLSREVAPKDRYLAAIMLPTTRLLEPLGDVSFHQVYEAYKEEVMGYAEGGVDCLWFLTFADLWEMEAALKAGTETGLRIIATMAFDPTPRGPHTMMGVAPKEAATRLVECGADIVGANCGKVSGQETVAILKEMRQACPAPLIVKPNGGIAPMEGDKLAYSIGPEEFARHVPDWVEAGARIVGGCCATGPGHAAAIIAQLREMGLRG
ncbi:MAG TPA: hypothetical protein G4O03_06160 [Dehalococcoidia bacterium]|nr:hypothetical protein [Dehalococcoidia bacterium]